MEKEEYIKKLENVLLIFLERFLPANTLNNLLYSNDKKYLPSNDDNSGDLKEFLLLELYDKLKSMRIYPYLMKRDLQKQEAKEEDNLEEEDKDKKENLISTSPYTETSNLKEECLLRKKRNLTEIFQFSKSDSNFEESESDKIKLLTQSNMHNIESKIPENLDFNPLEFDSTTFGKSE